MISFGMLKYILKVRGGTKYSAHCSQFSDIDSSMSFTFGLTRLRNARCRRFNSFADEVLLPFWLLETVHLELVILYWAFLGFSVLLLQNRNECAYFFKVGMFLWYLRELQIAAMLLVAPMSRMYSLNFVVSLIFCPFLNCIYMVVFSQSVVYIVFAFVSGVVFMFSWPYYILCFLLVFICWWFSLGFSASCCFLWY